MKQGVRPTRKQKIAIKEAGLISEQWLVEREGDTALMIVHREKGTTRQIAKIS